MVDLFLLSEFVRTFLLAGYGVLLNVTSYPVLISVLVGIALFWWTIRPHHVDPSLPGPERHWLLGVVFGFDDDVIQGEGYPWSEWPTLSRVLSARYNYHTWGCPTPNIGFGGAFFNVVSPDCLTYILRDNAENYIKGKLTNSFSEVMGRHNFAFNTDGDEWKFHRKIAVSILNRETIVTASEILLAKLKQVDRHWHRIMSTKEQQQSDATESVQGEIESLDFQEFATKLILDVFCKLGFNVELNTLEDSTHTNNSTKIRHAEFAKALEELNFLIHCRFNDLLWEYKQMLGIGRREQRVKELTQIIDKFAYDMIEDVLETIKQEEEEEAAQREDSLDKTSDQPSPPDIRLKKHNNIVRQYLHFCRKEGHPEPTKKDLRDLVVGFTSAGRDSTATGLAWTMYELTRHPGVLDRVREEIHQVVSDQELTYELVQRMPFLHWTVIEALRLHPPFPENFRFAVKEDVLPDGTRIPADSLVMFSACTINYSEKVWVDPETFNPDRFRSKEPSPFQFATFNAGPRACPGRALSMMEIKMTLAYLLPRFDFEDLKKHSGDYHWTLVMAMKEGFPVRIRPRDSAVG